MNRIFRLYIVKISVGRLMKFHNSMRIWIMITFKAQYEFLMIIIYTFRICVFPYSYPVSGIKVIIKNQISKYNIIKIKWPNNGKLIDNFIRNRLLFPQIMCHFTQYKKCIQFSSPTLLC